MKQDDATKITALLVGTSEMMGSELSEAAIALYLNSLDGLTPAEVSTALKAHLRDPDRGRFMPKPADLIEKLESASGLPSASSALDQVIAAYSQGKQPDGGPGARYCPDEKKNLRMQRLLHPVVYQAFLRHGGWRWIAYMPTGEVPFTRKPFAETVETIADERKARKVAALEAGRSLKLVGSE